MRPRLLWLAPVVFFAWNADAAERGPVRLGIFDIAVVGADPGLARTSIDALATVAATLPNYRVISRTELDAMLGAERLKDAVGCDDVSCLAEVGMAAGVERLVAGSLSKVGEALVVSLQLVNVEYASVENRVTLSWDGPLQGLADVLGAAVELLLIPARDRKSGTLALASLPADAAVLVDDRPNAPLLGKVEGLAVGVHQVRVEAPGYEPFTKSFVVRNGGVTDVAVHLTARPEPAFYTRWWFWTGAAAVVAGGTAAALLIHSSSSDPASHNASGSFVTPVPPTFGLTVGGQ